MRSGYHHLRTMGRLTNVYHINANGVALNPFFAGNLLALAEISVHLVAASADANGNAAVDRINPQHGAGEHFMGLGGESAISGLTLSLTNALNDNALGGLGCNTAKLLCLGFHFHQVALNGAGHILLRLGNGDFGGGELNLLHHFLLGKQLHLAVDDVDGNVLGVAGVILFISSQQRLGDLVQHVLLGDALFLFQLVQCSHNFGVHFSNSSNQNSA